MRVYHKAASALSPLALECLYKWLYFYFTFFLLSILSSHCHIFQGTTLPTTTYTYNITTLYYLKKKMVLTISFPVLFVRLSYACMMTYSLCCCHKAKYPSPSNLINHHQKFQRKVESPNTRLVLLQPSRNIVLRATDGL